MRTWLPQRLVMSSLSDVRRATGVGCRRASSATVAYRGAVRCGATSSFRLFAVGLLSCHRPTVLHCTVSALLFAVSVGTRHACSLVRLPQISPHLR